MIYRKTASQMVNYLSVSAKGKKPINGFFISHKKVQLKIFVPPLSGMANVKVIASSLCGSDAGSNGYYWGGRHHADFFQDKKKLFWNLKLMKRRGVLANLSSRKLLLRIPNHEGWGIVQAVTPKIQSSSRQIATFVPKISSDTKKIQGFLYKKLTVNTQNLKKGDWVIITAYLNCNQHWQIDKGKSFPDKCNRSMERGHIPKQVPGHGEIYGLSYKSEFGLPLPNQMLIKVKKPLRRWIEKDSHRRKILLLVEPLSCCFEAFSPLILLVNKKKQSPPNNIAILGDGANAALLALTATAAFPKAEIFVTGKTDVKLRAISSINPVKIKTIQVGGQQRSDISQLSNYLCNARKKGESKLDVLIPTFPVTDLHRFKSLIDYKTGMIIVWAADQVGDNRPFKGLVKPGRIHHSYGGWNWAEWTALNFLQVLAKIELGKLEALINYPFLEVNIRRAASVMNTWLKNKGRFQIFMGGRKTSAKIIINH